ncbi:MAG: sugar transferase [Bacteroidia bacterium]|nr:sugar transferase [Bacteroidia bacterium]
MNAQYEIFAEQLNDCRQIRAYSQFHRKTDYSIFEFVKRVFDVLISVSLIFILLPFWLFIILVIKITSRGPVLYKAKVIGLDEREFIMYKFRSMYYRSSHQKHEKLVIDIIKNNKPTEKIKSDSRITRFGKFMRKYSIDEFPQLINVIRGEMSLIGPRPCLPYEYEVMNVWHRKRFAIKPGISGLWQILGRNKIRFNEQIALDIFYIDNRSLKLDIEILFNTLPVIFLGRGGV